MKIKMTPIQKMTLSAMLIVICILGTRLPGFAQVGGPFSFNRITLGPAVVIFSSLVLGPLYGFVVGAGSDALGWVLMGTHTGAMNVFITLLYGLLGVVPWLLVQFTKKFRFKSGTPWSLYALIFLLWTTFMVLLLATDWFDTSFVKWGLDPSACKYVFAILSFLLSAGMMVGLYFSNKYFQKRSLDLALICSPYEIAFICLVSEILFMVLLKPLGFYGYCWVFLGGPLEETWGVSYSLLALISTLFAFPDIVINTFIISWLLILSKHYLHYYGEEIKQDIKALKEDISENPEIDYSQLSEEDKAEMKGKFPLGWIIFFGVVIVLMVVAIVLIAINGWPSASESTIIESIGSAADSLNS